LLWVLFGSLVALEHVPFLSDNHCPRQTGKMSSQIFEAPSACDIQGFRGLQIHRIARFSPEIRPKRLIRF
jgi:hypothetical protein